MMHGQKIIKLRRLLGLQPVGQKTECFYSGRITCSL